MKKLILLLLLWTGVAHAQGIAELCAGPVRARTADFTPGGIILTYFDGAALWVYDIGRSTRYPLPETVPCVGNCRLSPDARWITYLNPQTMGYMKMRVNGTERTPIVDNAADVLWAPDNHWLVWTADLRAYLLPEGGTPDQRRYLPAEGMVSIQPAGQWGVRVASSSSGFYRYLVNLDASITAVPQPLAPDALYFNAANWSPDGQHLAYVGLVAGPEPSAELFVVKLDGSPPRQVTQLASAYGPVRIDGASPLSLAWSPDSSRIAYWVLPLAGDDLAAAGAEAALHITDLTSGITTRYCFSTAEHTPNPPHIVWSPDASHLAFGGNVQGDGKGYLLLALDVASGQLTEMSDGIFPALGAPDVLAWGLYP
jgi:WD40 repeat protein